MGLNADAMEYVPSTCKGVAEVDWESFHFALSPGDIVQDELSMHEDRQHIIVISREEDNTCLRHRDVAES